MPGTKRTFTYILHPRPGELERVLTRARRVLAYACEGDKRVSCLQVSGEALGVVTLNMTIHGRDRWWTTQLAQDILDHVIEGIGAERLDLSSVQPEPHDHRGYAHGRTKRHRSPRTPQESPEEKGAGAAEAEFK